MFPLNKRFDLIVRSNRLFKENIQEINFSSSSTVIVRSHRLFKGKIPGINFSSSSTAIVR
jgi:hypothetical protein